ncbi:MAG: DNA-directed RNA polymerase subunit alpha [Tissierellia bacterium]|nr:DNA-directed RNA polymerase subunit alpha [Tissierellia bacterium]
MTEKLNTKIEIVDVNEAEHYGKFVITPLEGGYGTTLGNSLRRVLLSSLPGAAITKMKIEGVSHELSTIDGVLEDVTEIVLNLKGVAIKKFTDEPVHITLDVKGPMEVVASDLMLDTDIEISNPDHHIASLNEDASLRMDLTIENGTGYELSETKKERLEAEKQSPRRERELESKDEQEKEDIKETDTIGEIILDALYTPVEKVNFQVSNARVGQVIDYDKLVLEVWTNGTLTPQEAMAQGAEILMDYLNLFAELPNYKFPDEQEVENDNQDKEALYNISIEDLDLSLRSFNCLKRANINTVGEIIDKEREDIMKIKNFGKKSMEEVEGKIQSLGLQFKGEENEE